VFAIPASAAAAAAFLSARSQSDAARWQEFTSLLKTLRDVLDDLYQLPPPQIDNSGFAEMMPLLRVALRLRTGRGGSERVVQLLRTLPMAIGNLLDEWFSDATLKAAVSAGAIQGVRQGPRSGGTVFTLLHHLVGAEAGSVRARPWLADGPDALVNELQRVLTAQGAPIRTGVPVTRILIHDYAVKGVQLADGSIVECDSVVSTGDPRRTLRDLVEPEWLDPELRREMGLIKSRDRCGFVSHVVAELPPGLANAGSERGPISLSESMDVVEQAYDASKYNRLAETPHVEIMVASERWPVLAPPGASSRVVVARVHFVPAGTDRNVLGQLVESRMEAVFPGYMHHVLHSTTWTPEDVASLYGEDSASLSHGELTLDQILFMRPRPALSRYSTAVSGLFLGGRGSHPGPGVSGAAGVLAAMALLHWSRGNR
jgi:phytoene dehydrogenase-like protein